MSLDEYESVLSTITDITFDVEDFSGESEDEDEKIRILKEIVSMLQDTLRNY